MVKKLMIVVSGVLFLTSCENVKQSWSSVNNQLHSAGESVHESTTQVKRLMASMDEQHYVPGIPDMPVYKGFTPLGNDNAVYDVNEGRIIDITYTSNFADYDDVKQFYSTSLNELGWKPAKALNTYVRDHETLLLEISRDGQIVTLHIVLQPADK